LRNPGVVGEEHESLDNSLSDEDAVEGVFVNRGKTEDRNGVFAGNGQFDVAIV